MIRSIFVFYRDGFKNMKLGKTLWFIIAVKIVVIFVFIKVFIYGESLHDMENEDKKSAFVLENLTSYQINN